MQPPPTSPPTSQGRAGFRDPLAELALVGTTLVGIGSLVQAPLVFVVACLAAAAVGLGMLAVIEPDSTGSAQLHAVIVPGVAVGGSIMAVRLLPPGLLLVPAVACAAVLLSATLTVERRIQGRVHGPTPGDRGAVRALALIAGALAFAGVAAGIPGALVEPNGFGVPGAPVPADAVAILALADAAVASILGYRLAVLREIAARETALAAVSYGLVIGIAAAALRAMAIPRFLGPALLVLVLYLWDAYRATPRPARRDLRSLWEVGLLLLVGVVVVAWNLLARG